jgi:uncharacterized membrane protein YfcA
MMATELIAFLVIFLAMSIRTLSGFGSALLSIPLLSLLYGTKYAIPFIMVYECLIDLMILAKGGIGTKEEVKRALPLLIAGLIGIPLGTQVLIFSSESLLRIVMGVALIVFSLISLRSVDLRIKREKEGFFLAGLLGGFLCGSIGMPGPPMALFLSSQGFAKQAFRRVIVIFLTIIDFLTFGYFIWMGLITTDMLLQSLRLLPALILGFLLGNFAFGKVDAVYFKRLVMVITISAGFVLISSTV